MCGIFREELNVSNRAYGYLKHQGALPHQLWRSDPKHVTRSTYGTHHLCHSSCWALEAIMGYVNREKEQKVRVCVV